MQVNYTASPTLSSFHQDDTYFRGIRGPYGSGKTTGMVFEVLMRARAMPPMEDGIRRSRWVVIRNSYRELMDSTMLTWFFWVPESVWGPFRKSKMIHEVRFEDVELDVYFRSLDQPRDVAKVLGTEYTAAWLNEGREIPKPLIDALESRIGRFPGEGRTAEPYWSGIIADTNPPDTAHWWHWLAEEPEHYFDSESPLTYEEQIDEIRRKYSFWGQPSGRSPQAENLKNLKPNYYQNLAVGKSPEWQKIYIDGEYGFLAEGKLVYPEYRDGRHCDANLRILRGVDMWRGWDWGLTPACVLVQISPRGQVLVHDEIIADDLGVERFADVALEYCMQRYSEYRIHDVGDPSGMDRAQTDEKTCFEILAAKGVIVEAGARTLYKRLESVRKPLNTMIDGKPGFLLHPRCATLRKGFRGGYQYRRMHVASALGEERFTNTPDKNLYSHVHDALNHLLSVPIGATLIEPNTDEYFSHSRDEMEDIRWAAMRAKPHRRGRNRVTGY